MMLYHTTLKRNLRSIKGHGLLTSKSQGKMKAVWLHEQDKTAWAFLHVVKRHGGRVEDVVTLAVEVDPKLVKRSAANGLYYTLDDVQPEYLRGVTVFQMVAASPLEGR